jgi:hypothetical protein
MESFPDFESKTAPSEVVVSRGRDLRETPRYSDSGLGSVSSEYVSPLQEHRPSLDSRELDSPKNRPRSRCRATHLPEFLHRRHEIQEEANIPQCTAIVASSCSVRSLAREAFRRQWSEQKKKAQNSRFWRRDVRRERKGDLETKWNLNTGMTMMSELPSIREVPIGEGSLRLGLFGSDSGLPSSSADSPSLSDQGPRPEFPPPEPMAHELVVVSVRELSEKSENLTPECSHEIVETVEMIVHSDSDSGYYTAEEEFVHTSHTGLN